VHRHAGWAKAKQCPPSLPNPYEVPGCQETDAPSERILLIFFRCGYAKRRPSLATCSVCISVGWCTNVTAPHTYCGSSAIGMAVTESIDRVLCALETYLYPHTVLLKHRATHLCAPVRLRCGGGAAHGHHQGLSPYGQEREQASHQTRRVRAKRLWAHGRSSTHEVPHGRAQGPGCAHRAPVRRQAHLLPSLSSGEKCPDRTRPSVATCNRPHGLIYGRGPSTPCLCHTFSPNG